MFFTTNTTLTMKEKNISVLQGVCATVVFVAYFLPWAQVSILGSDSSISFAAAAYQLASLADKMPLAYLIPLGIVTLGGINVLWQWLLKTNVGAFYMNSIPLCICVAILAGLDAIVGGSYLQANVADGLGAGFYLTFLASLVSCVAAWTSIGRLYLVRYKGYMTIITILTVLCYALGVWANTWHLDFDMDYEEMIALEKRKNWTIMLTHIFSLLHFPFVIYGWIVFAIRGKRRWQILQEASSENLTSAPEKTNTKTVWVKDEEETKRYMEENNIH